MIARFRLPLLSLCYLGIFFILYGYYFSINDYLLAFHRNPFVRLPVPAQYLHGSPLGALVGHLLGMSGNFSTRIFYIVLVMLCLAGLYSYVRARIAKNIPDLGILLALVALTPLLFVLFSCVGASDPLLILAYLGFVGLGDSRVTRNGMLFFMLLAHREMAFFMLLVWFVLYRPPWRSLLSLWPGVFLAALWFGLYSYVLGGFSNRIDFVAQNSLLITQDLIHGFPLVLLLTFGWFWGVLGVLFVVDEKNRVRYALAALVAVGVGCITVDHIRVAFTVGIPLVLFALERMRSLGLLRSLGRPAVVCMLLGAGLLQVGYSRGVVYTSN